jgi:sigma-E factor negative regulatory protein RseA
MNQAGMNQAGMNPENREQLSAAVDGELSAEELRFLLRRLDHDAALSQAWSRYHLAGEGVRRQVPALASADFAARVMRAIERESAAGSSVPAPGARRHWLHWSAGGAIAASVAVAALLLVQPAGETSRVETVAVDSTSTSPLPDHTALPSSAVPATVPPWLSGNSAELYSQRASATLGVPGGGNLMPYARDGTPMHRYRTLDNHDGSYLLLLDPQQQRDTANDRTFPR